MSKITCPECGCIIHLEWKTPKEIKKELIDKTQKKKKVEDDG